MVEDGCNLRDRQSERDALYRFHHLPDRDSYGISHQGPDREAAEPAVLFRESFS